MTVLVINCGSSSVKFALFDGDEELIAEGRRERLGADEQHHSETHEEAVAAIFETVSGHQIDAVGHRVVHGGPDINQPNQPAKAERRLAIEIDDVFRAVDRHENVQGAVPIEVGDRKIGSTRNIGCPSNSGWR